MHTFWKSLRYGIIIKKVQFNAEVLSDFSIYEFIFHFNIRKAASDLDIIILYFWAWNLCFGFILCKLIGQLSIYFREMFCLPLSIYFCLQYNYFFVENINPYRVIVCVENIYGYSSPLMLSVVYLTRSDQASHGSDDSNQFICSLRVKYPVFMVVLINTVCLFVEY